MRESGAFFLGEKLLSGAFGSGAGRFTQHFGGRAGLVFSWGACFWGAFLYSFLMGRTTRPPVGGSCAIIAQIEGSKMATKDGKATSNKNDIHAGIEAQFGKVVGGSLAGELKAFASLASAMQKGRLSVRGAQATIAKVENETGSLPSFRSSWCRFVLDVVDLQEKEGGAEASLKRLFNMVAQGRKAFNGKNGAPAWADVVASSNTLEGIEVQIPSETERKREAHHNDTDSEDVEAPKVQTLEEIIREAGKRLKAGERVEDVKLLEAFAVAVAKELQRAKASASMGKAVREVAQELAAA